MSAGERASPDANVAAARAAVPVSALHRYLVPATPGAAVRILVSNRGEVERVTLDPHWLAVLRAEAEERRPFRLLFHLHGVLLAGMLGSILMETAACCTIVMLLTGVYLWWPRGARALRVVLYPHRRAGPRLFWRDLHAMAGI